MAATSTNADPDFDYALSLQFGDSIMRTTDRNKDSDVVKKTEKQQKVTVPSPKGPVGIVDSYWELADPNPNIYELFMQFDALFFDSILNNRGVSVQWSPRMTLCAGVCKYERRGHFCTVHLSTPLLKLRPRKDLVETLLHEMIHALLFVTENNQDRSGHGPNFQFHMHRINQAAGTKITIYHSFHDEVKEYRQHWWRCKGTCRDKPPFFGYVKRSMNRAPSHNDLWWAEHQLTCGGEFEKIKEPENYKKKETGKKKAQNETKGKGKASSSKSPQVAADVVKGTGSGKTPSIVTLVNGVVTQSDGTAGGSSSLHKKETSLFPGKGQVLGSGGSPVPAVLTKTEGFATAGESSQSRGDARRVEGKVHPPPVLPLGSATNDARSTVVPTKAGSKRPAQADIRTHFRSSDGKVAKHPVPSVLTGVRDENQPCSSKDILGGSSLPSTSSRVGVSGCATRNPQVSNSLQTENLPPTTARTSSRPDVIDLTMDSPDHLQASTPCLCPVCGVGCSQKTINQHLDECLAM